MLGIFYLWAAFGYNSASSFKSVLIQLLLLLPELLPIVLARYKQIVPKGYIVSFYFLTVPLSAISIYGALDAEYALAGALYLTVHMFVLWVYSVIALIKRAAKRVCA